jgi:hypothetical protein
MLAWLNPDGGKFAIVLNSEHGGPGIIAHLMKTISPDAEVPVDDIADWLRAEGYIHQSRERLTAAFVETDNFEEMVDAVKFLLIDSLKHLSGMEDKIRGYVKNNLWDGQKGKYRLQMLQEILVVDAKNTRKGKTR